MPSAPDPETRTTPIPLRPVGVDSATIVSSEETILCSPSRTLSRSRLPARRTRPRVTAVRPVLANKPLLTDADHISRKPVQCETARASIPEKKESYQHGCHQHHFCLGGIVCTWAHFHLYEHCNAHQDWKDEQVIFYRQVLDPQNPRC